MGIRKPAGAPVLVGEFGTVSVSCGLDCVMEAGNGRLAPPEMPAKDMRVVSLQPELIANNNLDSYMIDAQIYIFMYSREWASNYVRDRVQQTCDFSSCVPCCCWRWQ